MAAGNNIPVTGTVFISVRDADKAGIVSAAASLRDLGFKIVATGGTQRYLIEKNIECEKINKVLEGRPHIVDAMKNGDVDIVFNTTQGAKALIDSASIRRTALLYHIPYYTTLAGASAVTRAIEAMRADNLKIAPIQSYINSAP